MRKIRFWINFFTTPQTFKQNNYFVSKCKLNIHITSKHESRFYQRIGLRWKNCFEIIKICWKTRSQRIIYLVNLHHKNVKVGLFCAFSEKLFRKKLFFFIKNLLDQNFWRHSIFESFVVQRLIFWIKIFKCVRLSAVFSQLDKFRIENFRLCQIPEKKFYNA